MAWLATEAVFKAVSKIPTLTARHAKVLIDQLLDEPHLASPTADGLVAALLRGEGALAGLLFNREAVDLVMALPDDQRRHLAQHMALIAERMEAGTARMAQAAALDRVGLAEHRKIREQARADEAEVTLARTQRAAEVNSAVSARLAEIAASASQATKPELLAGTKPTPEAAVGAAAPAANVPPLTPAAGEATLSYRTGEPPLLSELVGRFFKAKQYPAHTEHQSRATIRMWMEVVGDKRTNRYTEDDAFRFQDALRQLPASHGKSRRPISVPAAIADSKDKAIPRLSEKTIERHFSLLRQLWKHLTERIADQSIFDGIEHKVVAGERLPWSVEALDRLLRARWNPKNRKGVRVSEETHAWLVAIGAYTGARVEEIARLRPQDVVEVEGDWFFIIQTQKAEKDKGRPAWTTKSPAGRRAVAIHPTLLEAGILRMVEARRVAGAERLFELTASGPNGNLAAEYSREFSRHKTAIGTPGSMVFHSFRHNVETILGSETVKQNWIDTMLGHKHERPGDAPKSVGLKVYFHGLTAEALRQVADAVTYPDDVCPTLLLRRVRGEVPW
nr:tyrosine-type recombinase/integrase [Belnapia moabensis]